MEIDGLREKNPGLDMCLTLGSSVSRWDPLLFNIKSLLFKVDPHFEWLTNRPFSTPIQSHGFKALQHNCRLDLELKPDVYYTP